MTAKPMSGLPNRTHRSPSIPESFIPTHPLQQYRDGNCLLASTVSSSIAVAKMISNQCVESHYHMTSSNFKARLCAAQAKIPRLMVSPIMNCVSAAFLNLALASVAVGQQPRLPTVDEMHTMFEVAARQANSQIANTQIDDLTVLKLMTYDRNVPVMTYHYKSTALSALKKKDLDATATKAMIAHHRNKTCGTHFAPFMRVYGLKVAHRFEDAATGSEMITITVEAKNCP